MKKCFLKRYFSLSAIPNQLPLDELLALVSKNSKKIKTHSLSTGLVLLLLLVQSAAFTNLNLSSLDGANGFSIGGGGVMAGNELGRSVKNAGDVNGDSFDDVIIGTLDADKAFVVFGTASGIGNNFNLTTLNGTNGFVINAATAGDRTGHSVSGAGDFNGDGFDDIIVGAPYADPNGGNSGQAYLIFGKSSFSSPLNLASLGANGFAINGTTAAGQAGFCVAAAGDFNNDNFDDVIIGAPNAGVNADGRGYVVFGKAGGFATLELTTLPSSDGIVVIGNADNDRAGTSVNNAGDVNGDGFDDVMLGAQYAAPNGTASGQAYVVFGKAGMANVTLAMLNGADGFIVNGAGDFDRCGFSINGVGDINGDGVSDMIIGAHRAPDNTYIGQAYVVFGKQGSAFSTPINPATLNGNDGFRINGALAGDLAGSSVSSAGDFNGDGIDDLLVGAFGADPNGNMYAGQTYVVFGKTTGFSPTFTLSSINGDNGFVINGIAANDRSGSAVSRAGDFNGDGGADLLIGAPQTASGGNGYIIFGISRPVGDLAGNDQEVDLVLQQKTTVAAALMSNGVYQSVTTNIATLSSAKNKVVGINDFDLDGKSEIVVQQKSTVTVLGGSNFNTTVATLTLQKGHKVIGTGNVVGTGKKLPDILARKGSKVFAYEKTTNGFNSTPIGFYTNKGGFKLVGVGRFGSSSEGFAQVLVQKKKTVEARSVDALSSAGTPVPLPTGYKQVIGVGDFIKGGNWEVVTRKGKKIGIGANANVFTIPKKNKVVGPK